MFPDLVLNRTHKLSCANLAVHRSRAYKIHFTSGREMERQMDRVKHLKCQLSVLTFKDIRDVKSTKASILIKTHKRNDAGVAQGK